MENYAIALYDANESIRCDPTYSKGYYRRGSANVALNHYGAAVKDFKKVCQLEPQNKDAREKYMATQKEYKEREFAKCIQVEEKRIEVRLEDIVVEPSYSGPKLETPDQIDAKWVTEAMSYMQGQKVIHKKFAIMILLRCREIFEKDASLVHITVPDDKEITVCGDIHG